MVGMSVCVEDPILSVIRVSSPPSKVPPHEPVAVSPVQALPSQERNDRYALLFFNR